MAAKTSQLQIRVSAAEKSAIRAAARRADMDISAWVLERVLPGAQRRFNELTTALAGEPTHRRLVLAALNDLLAGLDAGQFATALADAPSALDARTLNYVAAMIETAAHRLRIAPPAWTRDVRPLAAPLFGSTLPGLRLHLLTASPPAFKRRNIFIDSTVGDRV